MIRPLVLTPEKDIKYFVRHNDIPVTKSLCPEDKNTDREKYKLMLAEMEKTNEGVRHRIFCAIKKAGIDGYAVEKITENETSEK